VARRTTAEHDDVERLGDEVQANDSAEARTTSLRARISSRSSG
jgi:hypothetical protein